MEQRLDKRRTSLAVIIFYQAVCTPSFFQHCHYTCWQFLKILKKYALFATEYCFLDFPQKQYIIYIYNTQIILRKFVYHAKGYNFMKGRFLPMNSAREPMENDSNSRTAEELEQQTVDVYVERALHGPVFRMSYEHTHTYCEIFYLKSGTCTYTVNQGQWHLEAGDLFIVAAGDPHSTRYEGKTSCERIIVFCKSDILASLMRSDPTEVRQTLERSGKVILNAETRTMVETLLDQMLLENDLPRKYSEQVLDLESLHLVLLLLRDGIFSYETMSPKEGYSADIERALKYIALNYQQPLTLEEVAGYCNLSPTYFSRKFKLITGQTFKEHVNYIRLRQATQMLLTTDNSITKIAMLCGFGSSNYFKDLFRATTGRSPREYRKHSGLPIHPHLRDNG